MELRRYLTLRYLVALTLVAGLATLSLAASLTIISEGRHNAELINLSGRQRMLSQSILLSTLRIAADSHAEHRSIALENLKQSIDSMRKAHQILTRGSEELDMPPPQTRKIRRLYFAPPENLDARVRDFLDRTEELLRNSTDDLDYEDLELQSLLDLGTGELLDLLDRAAAMYQEESEADESFLVWMTVLAYATTLLLLALVGTLLFRPMTNHIVNNREVLEDLNKKLERMAEVDELTGCYNRRKFNEIMAREQAMAERYGHALSVIMFDLDHFKQINDNHGHQAGDEVLEETAHLIGERIRATDYLSRWGGEEFAIILPATPLSSARSTADKLRREVEGHPFPHGLRLTASLGVAEYRKGESADSFIDRADRAMYAAKEDGRNSVRVDAGG